LQNCEKRLAEGGQIWQEKARSTRALVSQDAGLVMAQAFEHAGDVERADWLMRRCFELAPEEETLDAADDGLIRHLVRNACAGVELLERLEQKYPQAVAAEAACQDRWPVLRRKHDRTLRGTPVAAVLGTRCPLDSEAVVHSARKNSLRAWLTPLVLWIHRHVPFDVPPGPERRRAAEQALRRRGHPWFLPLGSCPPVAVRILTDAADLPPLTKSTAALRADKAVVPFIMATDAAEVTARKEPALRAIWNQGRVKSPKTFRSRLRDAVRRELPRMVRQ